MDAIANRTRLRYRYTGTVIVLIGMLYVLPPPLSVQSRPTRTAKLFSSPTIFDTTERLTHLHLLYPIPSPLPPLPCHQYSMVNHCPHTTYPQPPTPYPPIHSLNTTQHIIRARAKSRIKRPPIARIRLPRINADAVLIRAETKAAFAGGAFFERGAALREGVLRGGGHGEGGGEGGG
ncbi:MAG: hypothetical protein L6R42_010642 [Xanthoria sp. 1 TBL-2021]|nr:MAG: hypothetical protein L6R42_010642 [Xanthoria sp. 1 TBL-2021]